MPALPPSDDRHPEPQGRARGPRPLSEDEARTSGSPGDDAYARFAAYLERHVGITLGPSRAYLVDSRLAPVLAAYGLPDLAAAVEVLERRRDERLPAAIVDAMTTNETNWFRDGYAFRYLGEVLLGQLFARRRPIRFWSAACASGQEAYSIAMLVHEYLAAHPADDTTPVDIIATDVSGAILRRAGAGIYDALGGVRGLSPERLRRYFERTAVGFELKAAIRKRVSFRAFNLLADPAFLGRFDVVFLRNVLIYFAAETRQRLLMRVRSRIAPGGHLVLGASEAIPERELGFAMIKLPGGVVYQRSD